MDSYKRLAEENLAIFAERAYDTPVGTHVDLTEMLEVAVAGTRRFRPKDLPPAPAGPAPRVEVTAESTTAALHRLVAERENDIALLNFASATKPGGGFLRGARAQEEDLARASALYACLEPQRAFYEDNRHFGSALYLDDLLYSPAVPFFRDAELDLLDAPALAAVITAPAPNCGALPTGEAVGPALRKRAEAIVRVAAGFGHSTLLLGAWGCGVFRNDPEEVAKVFGDVLAAEGASFARVVFAVFERGASLDASPNGRAFLRLARKPV
jgi:uncharacterized protein (TIGR02452 family)